MSDSMLTGGGRRTLLSLLSEGYDGFAKTALEEREQSSPIELF